jgi:hypothetical protein
MENDDTPKRNSQTPRELSKSSSKKRADKQTQQSKSRANKANANKKKTLYEYWLSASTLKKFELSLLAIGTATGIAYVGVTVWGVLQNKWNFEFEHRGRVVLSRAPQLLGPVECDVENKSLHMPKVRFWFKASGGQIKRAYVMDWPATIIPDEKTGETKIDKPFPLTTDSLCQMQHIPNEGFPMSPGDELATDESESNQGFPVDFDASGRSILSPGWDKLTKDASVQFFVPACVFYTEENGMEHATCNYYRFALDSYTFSFPSGQKVYGKLALYGSGSCEN